MEAYKREHINFQVNCNSIENSLCYGIPQCQLDHPIISLLRNCYVNYYFFKDINIYFRVMEFQIQYDLLLIQGILFYQKPI